MIGVMLATGVSNLVDGFGVSYQLDNPEDVVQLRRFTLLAGPVISALDQFQKQNGAYPEHLSEVEDDLPAHYLKDLFLKYGAPYPSVSYVRHQQDSYRLFMKMNWEESLVYEADGTWKLWKENEEWIVIAGPQE